MALLDSEMQRCRFELGYNVLAAGAEPYISYVAVFDRVVQVYLNAGAQTTSATAVTAATTLTPVAITLASATGFHAGDCIVIDVDDRQEWATIQSLSGAVATVQLQKAHSGTYAVTVEGGEAIIREILGFIRGVKTEMAQTFGSGTIKKVDEIEFYGINGTSAFSALRSQLNRWRDELASALGVENLWNYKSGGGGGSVVNY